MAKNAIDWLSRPAADIPRVFGNKPVVLMGATPGPNNTLLAQAAWLPVLRALGTAYWRVRRKTSSIANLITYVDRRGAEDTEVKIELAN